MDNVSETQAAAVFTPACVKLPDWAPSARAAADCRLTHVAAAKPVPCGVKGRSVPAASGGMHAQQSIRKPYNFKARIYALGAGASGPHPAREPEPV